MSSPVHIAFETNQVNLLLEDILPAKAVTDTMKQSKKYKQIATSVKEVGIVEPLVVYPQKAVKDKFLLLDGHLRLEALKDIGTKKTPCLISKDDESFTFNKRINRLASVQEHYMILRAIDNGIPEDKIAKALGVNISSIRRKRTLLNGVCPEAVDIMKNRPFPGGTIGVMKRMKPLRQVEVADLMIAANNYTISYAKALLMATPPDQLKEGTQKKKMRGFTEEEIQRMEREMENLHRDMKTVEAEHGTNVVRLVVAAGYIDRLLDTGPVARYLKRHHFDLLTQLHTLTETLAIETGTSLPSKP